jgi:hypothetical protein
MLTDMNGNIVSYDDRHIRIEMPVDTEITLEGFGSAAPVTDEGFVSRECSSWRGRALAVFRAGYRDEMLMCHKVTQKVTDSRHNSVKIDT